MKNPAIEIELMVLEKRRGALVGWRSADLHGSCVAGFQDQAIRENKIDGDKLAPRLCFLVPVVDPTDPVEILSRTY